MKDTMNNVIFWIMLFFCLIFSNVVVAARNYKYVPSSNDAYAPSPNPSYGSASPINVIDYGAVGDGETDDSEAFIKAWHDICNGAKGDSVYLVPKGKTFLLKPTNFEGPCKTSSIQVEVVGNLKAPKSAEEWTDCKSFKHWLGFGNIQGLNFSGSGQLDGQGSSWWNSTELKNCYHPTALNFHNCGDLHVQGLTHLNGPGGHIVLNGCNNVYISRLHIIALGNSPNTDGIDISASRNVHIYHSFIGTGDDCIAINGGSSFINITDVNCGPGHGISVGSLGGNGANDTVLEVLVKNCTFNGTSNGARIKTWEGGSGLAANISFEDIIVHNSQNPIIIDQHYGHKSRKPPVNNNTAVKVTNVTYRNVHGTSASETGIDLRCSDVVPCTNIMFQEIKLTSSIPGKQIKNRCENVQFNNASALPCASDHDRSLLTFLSL